MGCALSRSPRSSSRKEKDEYWIPHSQRISIDSTSKAPSTPSTRSPPPYNGTRNIKGRTSTTVPTTRSGHDLPPNVGSRPRASIDFENRSSPYRAMQRVPRGYVRDRDKYPVRSDMRRIPQAHVRDGDKYYRPRHNEGEYHSRYQQVEHARLSSRQITQRPMSKEEKYNSQYHHIEHMNRGSPQRHRSHREDKQPTLDYIENSHTPQAHLIPGAVQDPREIATKRCAERKKEWDVYKNHRIQTVGGRFYF